MNDSAAAGAALSLDELEADILETRRELGDTVDALKEKLDVKSQIKSSTNQAKADVVDTLSSRWPEIAVVAITATLVAIVWKKL